MVRTVRETSQYRSGWLIKMLSYGQFACFWTRREGSFQEEPLSMRCDTVSLVLAITQRTSLDVKKHAYQGESLGEDQRSYGRLQGDPLQF